MKKKVNGFVGGILSACMCLSMAAAPMAASADTFVYEDFGSGTTRLTYRKNTASGTITNGAVENGVLKLSKGEEEGIATAYGTFSLQNEGVVSAKADICSDIESGTLFGLSENILGADIAVCVRDNRLVLVSGEKEADGGSFSSGVWKSYRTEIDYAKNCVTLFCDGNRVAQISDVIPCKVGSISFSITKSGKYMNIDNVAVSNDYEEEEVFSDIKECDGKDAILSLVERGIMQGMGNGKFSPDTSLTRAQMAQIITNALGLKYNGEALGYSDVSANDWYNYAVGAVTVSGIMNGMGDGTFAPNELLTFEQVNKILVESAEYAGISGKKYDFAESFDKIYVSTELTDEESVKYDFDTLNLGSLVVFQDINLPKVGEYGSEITWTSNSDIVTADGKVKRPDTESASALLTAHIKKGNVTATKDFPLSVMPCNVSWHVTETNNPHTEPLLEQSGDKISFSYDIVPGEDKLNTVMSFSSKSANLVSFAEMPVIIRFGEDGTVDAYNKNTYMADKIFRYQKGVKITIRVEIDVVNKCYSVLAQDGGKEIQIANNYAYRATAAPISTVGKMYIKRGSTIVPGTVEVTKMSIAAPEGIVDADKYLFDRNYASGGDASDVLSFLREGTKILPGTELPAVSAGGQKLVWISSDPELLTADGKLSDTANKNEVFTLTAVVNDKSPNSHSLLEKKDGISNWAFGYVATAMNMGIVENILAEETFNPKMPVTREYAAILVNRLLNIM